jgi:hypothetical protein
VTQSPKRVEKLKMEDYGYPILVTGDDDEHIPSERGSDRTCTFGPYDEQAVCSTW